jgi:hypothetical protein
VGQHHPVVRLPRWVKEKGRQSTSELGLTAKREKRSGNEGGAKNLCVFTIPKRCLRSMKR